MRVVAFLGASEYTPARYRFQDGDVSPCLQIASVGLAKKLQAEELVVLATEKAKKVNWEVVQKEAKAFAPSLQVRMQMIPTGHEPWVLLDAITSALEGAEDVALDITHGFRAHPFFAAAAVAYLRAIEPRRQQIRIFYFEFSGKAPQKSGKQSSKPDASSEADAWGMEWELSDVVMLLDWSRALGTFVRTGNAAEVAALLQAYREEEGRSGQRELAQVLGWLGNAIQRFSGDLAAVRVPQLLFGYDKNVADAIRRAEKTGKPLPNRTHPPSDVQRLLETITEAKQRLADKLPLLLPVLERLQGLVKPLVASSLAGKEGARAMFALARLYLEWDRLSEAATVLREAVVCLHADPRQADVGRAGFSHEARKALEQRLSRALGERWRVLAKTRNDIDHAGFTTDPEQVETLRENIMRLLDEWEKALGEAAPVIEESHPTTWFISRHPGALEWAKRQGIAVDRQLAHFGEKELAALGPGDVVIGTLPVHLAAEVCKKGARYFHLSLDLSPEARGRELSADEMEAYRARIEEYEVRQVGR